MCVCSISHFRSFVADRLREPVVGLNSFYFIFLGGFRCFFFFSCFFVNKASNCCFSKECSRNVLFGSQRPQRTGLNNWVKFICGCRTKCKLSRQESFFFFQASIFMMSCGHDCEWAICLICCYFGIVNQLGRLTARPDIMSDSSVCSDRPCDFSFSPSVLMLCEPLHLRPLRVCQKATSDRRKCSAGAPTSCMWREDFKREIQNVLWWVMEYCWHVYLFFWYTNVYMALCSWLWTVLLF